MKWLGYGWSSQPGGGGSIWVNNQRLCGAGTILALERLGLVEQIELDGVKQPGQWKATEDGKALTRRLCL